MGIIENINNAAARVLLGPQLKQAEYLMEQLIDVYNRRPYMRSPDELRTELSEFDDRMADLLLRQIDSASAIDYTSESIRLEIVRECRDAYVFDVVSQNVVDLWTNYGFGQNVEITPSDENAIDIWQEFWKSTRNSRVLGTRNIQVLSQEVLTAGEIFFVFYTNKIDGTVTLRYFESEEIKEIICDPDDRKVPLFYVREYTSDDMASKTIWYPDWAATDDQLAKIEVPTGVIRADQERTVNLGNEEDIFQAGTDVRILHAAHRRKGKSKRGFPLMTAGVAWSRAYRDFLQNRAAVAKAVATYVDSITTKGGSRAVDALTRSLQSGLVSNPTRGYDNNPPPTAGSTWIQNEQLDRKRMPLSTGAGDAEIDGAAMIAQAGLSGTIFPHYLGRGEAFRLATATAMEGPTLRAFNGYQLWWSSVWSDIVAYVEQQSGQEYEPGAMITLDPVIQLEAEEINSTKEILYDTFDRQLIDQETAAKAAEQIIRVSLQRIGINVNDTVFNTEE